MGRRVDRNSKVYRCMRANVNGQTGRIIDESLPWFFASTIWTLFVEVGCMAQYCCTVWMAFALDGESAIDMTIFFQQAKESSPQLSALPSH
jgi:hypothetical protein